jgi:16S rRNA (uracil1498-N3)-methyltransferase
VSRLTEGENTLDAAQAHHARNVLRLSDGEIVDLFDDHGATARGTLFFPPGVTAAVRVEAGDIVVGIPRGQISVASAVPKGDRADWMVEKLSELGVSEWIPLAAERSVVLPEGTGKRDRWTRIATEAAKQSQRVGVMRIGLLTKLQALVDSCNSKGAEEVAAWCLSTEVAEPAFAADLSRRALPAIPLMIFVGPEGGWTPAELRRFADAKNITFVRLTPTILRVETAAVAAAAVAAAGFASRA